MNNIVLSLFFFIAAIVGFTTSLLVLFTRKNYSKSFFLGLFLFSLAVVSVHNFYISAKVFRDFPDLFILTKAFIFLAAPCAFLYVRDLLFPVSVYKKYDWLHFLPFLVYFSVTIMALTANYTNIYLIDYLAEKIKSPFSTLSLTVWIFYSIGQTMMIINYESINFSEKRVQSVAVLGWIKVYTVMIIILFSTLFLYFTLFKKIDAIDYSGYIMISSVLVFSAGWLFVNPQIINNGHIIDEKGYSIYDSGVEDSSQASPNALVNLRALTQEKKQSYLERLDFIVTRKKLFLQKDLVMRDLAEQTGIKINDLSYLINTEFNVHFQDYINLKRIEYFKEKIDDPDWKDLSLEGMSWASGFKSRSTCFRAFIKHTGLSASEYLKMNRLESGVIKLPKKRYNYN